MASFGTSENPDEIFFCPIRIVNEENVLLYRDHRTVAKAPRQNEKKAGKTLKYYDISFSCTHDSK